MEKDAEDLARELHGEAKLCSKCGEPLGVVAVRRSQFVGEIRYEDGEYVIDEEIEGEPYLEFTCPSCEEDLTWKDRRWVEKHWK